MKKLKKVLIANRGEIAVRVIRACRQKGIPTVAIYSDVDRQALHVRLADEAVALGGDLASESYLDQEKIFKAVKKVGADSIHPGYGFLSENAEFSRQCRERGIKFIGPPPEAIAPMGDKIQARSLMKEAGVPVVPGSDGALSDLDQLKTLATEAGFPVMIKASAGGGGKGIRKVDSLEELEPALRQAASEAQQSFGDASVYLEKFIHPARHIEIQLMTDEHGNGVHFGERECSLQRRSQKLVEECPSPFVSQSLRQKIADIALKGALSINYVGAGTMEFLVDEQENFYFLEMNTRLQVEHTVTEMVTGVDLVTMQLDVAAGNPLAISQEEVVFSGHSIELRVCSEDPFNKFTPSIGTISSLHTPGGPFVRLDSCLYQGMEVTLFYDPMLAKLVVWAPDRLQAIDRMCQAIREFQITGVRTTLPLFLLLSQNDDFLSARFHTNWLEPFMKTIEQGTCTDESVAAIATALIKHLDKKKIHGQSKSDQRQSSQNHWRRLAIQEGMRRS